MWRYGCVQPSCVCVRNSVLQFWGFALLWFDCCGLYKFAVGYSSYVVEVKPGVQSGGSAVVCDVVSV